MLAASQAFGAHQGAQTKLATGAAAAALRSMTPTSTPVGQIQTKRMAERSNSIGAGQNAVRGRSRGNNLQRRSSSASMSERTFREPSPGRPPTSNPQPSTRNSQPPVPRLPQNYADVPPIPKKSSRRSVSIDDIQMRKRETMTSQMPNRMSMAAAPPATPRLANNPASTAARRVVSGTPKLERTDSQNSVNFSYPGRARPSSPPPQKQRTGLVKGGMPASPTTPTTPTSPTAPQGISPAEARNIQYQITQTAQQPVKKKKQRINKQVAEGSHLQTGTLNAKPVLTPLAPGPSMTEEHETQISTTKGQNTARLTGQASHFPSSPTSPTSDGVESDSDSAATRRVQRASGLLQKQPSVVREDWEGEQGRNGETPSPASIVPIRAAPNKQTAKANVSRKIEEPVSIYKSEAEPSPPAPVNPSSTLAAPQTKRGTSLSPSRSTRFSKRISIDMTEGQKHEPPPRSLSPMKPALKHSPSPKILAVDAARPRESSLTPSEATDISADGAPRRKKVSHVSFESEPAVVGTYTQADLPSSPQVASPQYREQGKKWPGTRTKAQNSTTLQANSDDEDSMKPRPQLPTFGSVRKGRNNEAETSVNQRTTSSPPSSVSSSSTSSLTHPTTMETSFSSDHAVGSLLSQQAMLQKIGPRLPVPSKMSLADGTELGYDTESVYSVDEDRTIEAPSQLMSSQALMPAPKPVDKPMHVPSIAVQPATPGPDEEVRHQDNWLVNVPGSFPPTSAYASGAASGNQAVSIYSNVTQQIDHEEPQAWQDRMPSIVEEDEDHDSVYSDAAEDLADPEGDGFGSINAIVRSPVVSSPGVQSAATDSPSTPMPRPDVRPSNDNRTESWDDTSARWKGLADTAKRSTLQPAAPIVEKSVQQPAKTNVMTAPNSKRETLPASSSTDGPRTAPKQAKADPLPMINTRRSDQSPALPKSLRSDAVPAASTTLRTNTRTSLDEAPKPIRSSMRASTGAEVGAAPAMRMKAVHPPAMAQATLQKKSIRAGSQPRQAPPPVNNDSDSESSFKRRRRAKSADPNKYNMRRSMRAGETAAPPLPPPATTQQQRQVRALSPTGGQSTMRMSMRSSMDDAPTLRNRGEGKRSSSLFGRNKAKSPTRPMSAAGFSSGMRSRFADSDDEGDRKPKTFKSRFGDSSDEEDELRPVRGIPRTTRNDDSTDLEDSSDEEGRRRGKTIQQKSSYVAQPALPSPSILERPTSPTLSDNKKKRGLFGRLRKGKDEAENDSVIQVNGNATSEVSKNRNANTAALGFRSDAEKEALIEQTRQKLEAARERPTSPTGAPGKLQRRVTPHRMMSDSWPLPPKFPTDLNERPHTADGPVTRLDLENGQPSSPASKTSSQDAGFGKPGKKKKFPLLRKAFGLKD